MYEVLGKSIKELKFSVKGVVEGVSIGELGRVWTGIVRVWNEGSSERFGRIHREKKVGELVGWIKRLVFVSTKVQNKGREGCVKLISFDH